MLTTTLEIIRAALKADETVPIEQRDAIIHAMRGGVRAEPARILRRAEVDKRLGIPLRTVDYWAQKGILRRVKLPGRRGAIGFVSSEVEAILNGGTK